MSKTVAILIDRPEGYEDVCDELVLEDFILFPKDPAWGARLLKPEPTTPTDEKENV